MKSSSVVAATDVKDLCWTILRACGSMAVLERYSFGDRTCSWRVSVRLAADNRGGVVLSASVALLLMGLRPSSPEGDDVVPRGDSCSLCCSAFSLGELDVDSCSEFCVRSSCVG